MKKIKFDFDEEILEETLENGLKIYLYPSTKTKNFYMTVSTFFGAKVLKYKKENKTYNITKGSAHFLEHRVMDFTKNKEAMEKLNKYGSLINAYTTYEGTNYNLFGHEKILENLEILFDRVFKASIKKEDVEMERGIILEEYYMYKDDPYYIMYEKSYENAFHNSYLKYPVIGTKEGIETVTEKELNRTYKDFYTPNNMFIVITGNFNKEEVLNFIKEYTKNLKKTKGKIQIIKEKEPDTIKTEYEEIEKTLEEDKIAITYKIPIPKNTDIIKYKTILSMLLNNTFGKVSKAFDELNKIGIKRYNYGKETGDTHVVISLRASTDKTEEFKKIVSKHIKNMKIDLETLERRKKVSISNEILAFEDINQIEDEITYDLFAYKKVINNRTEMLKNITMKDIKEVLKTLDFNNKTIIKMKKK